MLTIDICAGANERFMIGATTAFAGIALNAKPETELRFHIFTEDVKQDSVVFMRTVLTRLHQRTKVIEHVCNDELLGGLPYWAGSRLSAVRVFYPYLLKDLDWVLYVDCDILYFSSPEEHWSYRNGDYYVCVTKEEDSDTRIAECNWAKQRCNVEIPDEEYFNAGVMLFNLKKWRDASLPDRIQQFYKDYPDVRLPDQTAMNVLLSGKKIILPPKFDRLQIYLTDAKLAERPIVHYVSGNPWLPRLAVVANYRFRLWHQFCDKYVFQKDGKSHQHFFTRRMLVEKYILYWLLKSRLRGLVINLFEKLRLTRNGTDWCNKQVGHDCSEVGVRKVMNG